MEQKEPTKYMDLSEFREQGYLQEVNRLFFHPVGLEMEIEQGPGCQPKIKGIVDYRLQKGGAFFGISKMGPGEQLQCAKKAGHVADQFEKYAAERVEVIGEVYEGTGLIA